MVTIGDIRAKVDVVKAVLDRLAVSYRTTSQQVQGSAGVLSRAGNDSSRPELSDAAGVGHLATAEADRAAAVVVEAGRLCSDYAWQL